ncbi:MAG: zinc ribbon domain-containing protein [Solirubrobacterales bacterium]|nr:zinc ribbon domain-containing protein [Solirubrobacterales bacterium]
MGVSPDACVTCGAPLASDQRYCLNCGERRGKSRFPAALAVAQPAAAPTAVPVARAERRRRLSPGATLITGLATLLLALGVGVEIGRLGNSNSTPQRASAPVQVVTVGGSPGAVGPVDTAAQSTASTPQQSAKTGRSQSQAAATASQPKVVHVTKEVQAKASAAAAKVLGASDKNLAPATVQPGQSCSHGAGCQGGKFTGNFFSP